MTYISGNFDIRRSIQLEEELSISQATVRLWSSNCAKPLAYEVHQDTYLMALWLTAPLMGSRLSFRSNQCFSEKRLFGRLAFAGTGVSSDVSLPSGTFRVMTVEFDPDWFETSTGFHPQWESKTLSACVSVQHPELVHCLFNLANEVESPGRASKIFAESVATEAAIHMTRYLDRVAMETAPGQILSNWQMRRISDHIENMCGYMPEAATLAELCGVGERHLRRLFKQTTGKTISDYARDAWVAKIERWLADPILPLKDVASLAGFSDPCHFATAFRRVTGLTPKAFREHILASV